MRLFFSLFFSLDKNVQKVELKVIILSLFFTTCIYSPLKRSGQGEKQIIYFVWPKLETTPPTALSQEVGHASSFM